MQSKSMKRDSPTLSPSEISAQSEEPTYPLATGSSRAVSPARIFPSLVRALGWKVNDPGSGTSTPALLASYDHDTQSWRTLERSLFEGSIEYSGALPRSGTMRNGKIYAPPMSERPTGGSGSGLWRTPAAHDPGVRADRLVPIEGGEPGGMNRHFDRHTGRMAQIGLTQQVALREMWGTPTANDAEKRGEFDITNPRNGLPAAVKLWPTPCARDWFPAHKADYVAKKKAQGHGMSNLNDAVHLWPTPRTAGMCGGTGNWNQLKEKCDSIEEARKMGAGNGGQLNPTWVEWLMGYPLGWTDLNVSVIR